MLRMPRYADMPMPLAADAAAAHFSPRRALHIVYCLMMIRERDDTRYAMPAATAAVVTYSIRLMLQPPLCRIEVIGR